jgi:hypothetical protein
MFFVGAARCGRPFGQTRGAAPTIDRHFIFWMSGYNNKGDFECVNY